MNYPLCASNIFLISKASQGLGKGYFACVSKGRILKTTTTTTNGGGYG